MIGEELALASPLSVGTPIIASMKLTTVFYAWQSDLAEKGNHYLIRDAAASAIESLKAELAVDEAPRLDHDTKGVPGTPDIAQTIFDKIDSCAVFLADVSMVGSTETGGVKAKRIPNPNVLIELGYALRAVSHERIILVMNTAFGGPEELPFDLRARRHPIRYQLPTPDDPNRKGVEAQLARDLKVAIRAVIDSAPTTGRAGTEEAQRQATAEAWVAAERQRFEEAALREQFNGFKPERGALLVSVVPERPLSPVLNFSDAKVQAIRLRTIHGPAVPADLHGRRAVVTDVYAQEGSTFAATELRDNGVIVAADGFLLSRGSTAELDERFNTKIAGLVPSLTYEEDLARSIGSYLQIMREIGVLGPVHVAVSLFRIQGFVMGVDSYGMLMGHGVRQYQGEGISPYPVIFSESASVKTVGDVARYLRPIFDFVWREFGYPQSKNFDAAGEWRPK